MIHVIFGWINLVVMLWCTRYAYRRWFGPQIQAVMAAKNQNIQNLNIELSDLEGQVSEVSLDLVLQKQVATNLLGKVQNWQAVYLAQEQEQQAQAKILQVQIDTKNQLKVQNLALGLAQRQLFAAALAQAQEQLMHNFKEQQQAEQFLQQICTKLGRDAGAC